MDKTTCLNCGREFERKRRGRPRKHCSASCRLEYRKKSGSSDRAGLKWRTSPQGKATRKRAKLRDRQRYGQHRRSACSPTFDRQAIFARDHWRCQLCFKPVQTEQPQALDSATIRLIPSLAADGVYSLTNCETVCRRCNGRVFGSRSAERSDG